MNKIYKVIWSRVKNCYVVTNEFAKTHGKTATKAVAAAAFTVLVAGSANPVMAEADPHNYVGAEGATITGGEHNTVYGVFSSISSGKDNETKQLGKHSSISGGANNKTVGECSSISGGSNNLTTGYGASVSGGDGNSANGSNSSVLGGAGNAATGGSSSISGGAGNKATGGSSSISGGWKNVTEGDHSSVSGGWKNVASGESSSVLGGESNSASGAWTSVSGGKNNAATYFYASVSGGQGNLAKGRCSSISGGGDNVTTGDHSSVSGGQGNFAKDYYSSISGGKDNIAWGEWSTVGGGRNNASAGRASFVAGGSDGVAYGDSSTSIGGGIALLGGSTAIGFGAVTDEAGTIAFGHNKGDSRYILTKKEDGSQVLSASVFEDESYNRLVKIADGKTAHDAATVAQTATLSSSDGSVQVVSTKNANGSTNYDLKTKSLKFINPADFKAGDAMYDETNYDPAGDKMVSDYFVNEKFYGEALNLGASSVASSEHAVAIGHKSKVTGLNSTAVGRNNTVSGEDSIAIGTGHTVTGNHSGSFGDPNEVRSDYSFVLGDNNTIVAGADNNFIVGSNVNISNAEAKNNVVLGNDSSLGSAHVVDGVTPYGVVSVGAIGKLRQIQNVAPGEVAPSSTDAVNGGQLYKAMQNAGEKYTAGYGITIRDNQIHDDVNNVKYDGKNNVITLGKSVEKQGSPVKKFVVNLDDRSSVLRVYVNKDGKMEFIPTDTSCYRSRKYEFAGWAYNRDGSGRILTNDELKNENFVTNESTLYAIWRKRSPANPDDSEVDDPNINPDESFLERYYSASGTETGDPSGAYFPAKVTREKLSETVKITNLTNGEISEDSTDAVNGSQLYEAMRGLPTNPVEYTDATKEKIHLEGEAGTVIDRVKAGQLSKGSMEAVNGSQLYAVEQRFQKFQGLLTDVNTTVGNLSTSISDETTTNITQQEDIDVLNTQVANGFNVTIDGAKVKKINPQSNYINFAAGSGISLKATDAEGVEISVDTSGGKVEKNNSDVLNGGTVYTELRPVDGNYVKEAYTTAANLAALDTQAKANAIAISQLGDDKANVALDNLSDAGKTVLQTAAKDAVKVADGSNTTVTSEVDASGNISYKVTANATGTVADADIGLVSGKTVYDEVRPTDGTYVKKAETTAANLKALDTQTKANTDAIAGLGDSKAGVGLENITTAGENKIKEVMREGMDGKANIDASNITKSAWNTVLGTGAVATDNTELVTGKTVYTEVRPADGNFVKTDNTTAANLTALDTKVQEALTGVSGLGDNKANVGLDNLSDAGKTVIQQSAQSAVKVVDGENTTVTSEKDAAGNVSYKVKANADGTVTEGNTGLVSGGSVYNAITEGNKNAVQYDGDDHNTITLSGTGEDGTKITHLADGSLDKDSTDAVNGGQFYDYMQAVNQLLEGKSDANANNVGANAVVDNSEAWGSALGTGTVEKNNGKLVTGGTMFDELRPTDGEFVKQSNTTAANLLALDNEVALKANQSLDNINEDGKTVIKDLAKGAVKVVDGDNTTVSFVTDPDGNVSYKVKANATGEVAANNTGLVDGGTVYNAIKGLATEAALADKANTGLDNLSDAGKTTVKDLAKEAVKVKAGSNITVATDADGYTVGVKANGAVAAGDTGLLNGGALHTELRPTDGKYVKKSNTTAGNLTALDNQVQANTNKIDAMEQVIGDVSGKANADASNVAEHSAKWGAAIGTGEVAEGNGELVTGGTVFGAIDGAKTELRSEINKKADADLKNLSEQGKGVVRNLAKGAVKVEGKGAAIVTSAEKGDATVYTVDVKKDGKVEAGNDGIVTGGTVHDALQAATAGVNTALNGKADVGLTNLSEEGKQTIRDAVKDDLAGKADTGLSNLTEDGKNVIRDTMKNDLDKKADKDAGNIEVSKWASKLGNGEVKAGDKGLVNGDTVFEALKEVNGTDLIDEKDGAIRIGAKDKYDGLNTVDLSKSDGKGRVLTGVVTDPQRGDSAANVGYVNGVAGILQDNMNRGFQTMDGRINKAGARSAALAGLHPVDADSDQKWNVAIGYGNFKGENAAAAGIFYKPDDRFMINVSSTLQDQENMVSAGMSFALDKGSGLSSRRALNNKVNKLEDALKQVIAANNAMVQELNALKGQQMALNGMTKEFPDVPQNHWAHKAVTNLHGSDIVQGYPDGEFKGNRSMTRYEYAEMLYNAITAGKKVPAEMRREYAKELAEVKKARG